MWSVAMSGDGNVADEQYVEGGRAGDHHVAGDNDVADEVV